MFLSFRVVVRTWDCLCRVEALLQQKLLGALEPDSTCATATCAFPVKSHIWRKVAALVWDRCLLLLRQPLGAGLVDADIFVSRIQGGLRERERGKRERQVLHLVHLESGWQRSTPPPRVSGSTPAACSRFSSDMDNHRSCSTVQQAMPNADRMKPPLTVLL